MRFLALEQLIQRGLLNSARKLVQRIIKHSSSVREAVSAADFAVSSGVEFDMRSYDFLIRKLATCGEARMAEAVYVDFILSRGIEPDHYLLNSMVVCYSKLGKLDEAKSQFDTLIAMEIMPCRAACSEIICEFCAKKRVLEGFHVFLQVRDAEFLLNFRCYNWLVDGLSSRGYIDEALCVYDLMRDRGVPPTIHLLKTLVFMLCRSGRVEEAELLSLEMESLGFFLDKVMYTALINGYCQKGSMRMGMRLFYRMLKMGCHPDSYTCNTLMHGFLKLGMFDKMSVLLLQMEELGLKPNVVSYQITISKYCKDRKVDYALKLLNSMIQCNLAPTVYCYSPLLAALYKENQLAEVDQLYNQLSDRGLLPDEVLFFTVVKNHVEGHEINLAHKFVAEFARNGCGIDLSDICSTSSKSADDIMLEIDLLLEEIFSRNSGLARVAFNIYMIALCYGGRLEAALLCMDKMSNLSLQPSLPAYNSMVRCLYQKGRGEDAKSLVKVMQDQGLVPSMLTFLIMANEQCKQGDLPSAIGILDQLEDSGVKPSVAIYDSIIGCLAREKRIPKALELFARMHEAGILPDETMFVTMINGLSKDGRAFAAHELFKKMSECGIRPGYRAYTALINGFVKKNMIAEGRLYLDRMLKEGFMPNAALYTSLINQFLRKGEIEFALQLDDLMKRSQIEQDMITHVALVSGVCRNVRYISRKWHGSQRQFEKEKRKLYRLLCQYTNFPKGKGLKIFFSSRKERKVFALKMMDKVKETNFLPNLYLHNGVIAGYCWANNMQGAHCYLDMIMRKGLLPNHVTFTILIDGHIRSGNIDLAVNLFNNMNEHGCVPDNIVYNTLIRGFCKAGRLLDALSISNTMLKKGLSPSKASYENLLQCFCANNWTVHALKILEDMLAHEYIPCGFNLKSLVCILREENKCTEAYIVQTLKSRRRVLQFTGGEEKYLDEDYVRFLQCLQCEGYALKPLNRLFSDNKYVEYDRDDSEDVEVGNTLYEDSQFRQEITNILERPYDQTEYEKHLQDVKVQKPVERKLDLRYGRERWCPLTRIGKSYHDYFDGRTMVINVEYNQLDPLLRARGYPDGDVNCEKGYSPFPGNINQLIIEIGPYIEELTKTGEAIKEFVNPKYKDASKTAFKSSIRLECMMQDFILKHCPLLLESDLLWWMCGLLMHL